MFQCDDRRQWPSHRSGLRSRRRRPFRVGCLRGGQLPHPQCSFRFTGRLSGWAAVCRRCCLSHCLDLSCSHRGLSDLAFQEQRIAKRVKNPSTLRGNASLDEAERPLGCACCPADLSVVAKSPAKVRRSPSRTRARTHRVPRQDSRAAGGRSAATPIVGDRRTVTGAGSPKGQKSTWPLSARMGLRPNDPTIPIRSER